jgi:hypothetical protein
MLAVVAAATMGGSSSLSFEVHGDEQTAARLRAKAQHQSHTGVRVAGLSLSLASGAPAAVGGPAADMLTPKTGMSHEITLCEEEISEVA